MPDNSGCRLPYFAGEGMSIGCEDCEKCVCSEAGTLRGEDSFRNVGIHEVDEYFLDWTSCFLACR